MESSYVPGWYSSVGLQIKCCPKGDRTDHKPGNMLGEIDFTLHYNKDTQRQQDDKQVGIVVTSSPSLHDFLIREMRVYIELYYNKSTLPCHQIVDANAVSVSLLFRVIDTLF